MKLGELFRRILILMEDGYEDIEIPEFIQSWVESHEGGILMSRM